MLQEKEVVRVGGNQPIKVDFRCVAASNKSLPDLVKAGAFRPDLYYRLNVVNIQIPPLRDRREDIPLLADHFLHAIAKRDGTASKRISRDALRRLAQHPLPGNVRQLEHVLMNACVMVDGDVIEADDLALLGDDEGASMEGVTPLPELDDLPAAGGGALAGNLEEWKTQERQKILGALEAAGWNRVRAAKTLGMPRRTFYRRLKEYEIL